MKFASNVVGILAVQLLALAIVIDLMGKPDLMGRGFLLQIIALFLLAILLELKGGNR